MEIVSHDADVRFVPDYGLKIIELLAPLPGESILDLGCGDGQLSALVAKRGAGVVGLDISETAVAAARKRGIDARVMDARYLDFAPSFDAVFSHASIHWMCDADRVFAGAWHALKSGGRFVAETGAHRNCAAIHTAMVAALLHHGAAESDIPHLFYPATDECCDLLEATGFRVLSIESFDRPTPLPHGIEPWFERFGEPYFRTVAEPLRPQARRHATRLLEFTLRTSRGAWIADYRHLRFKAEKR